MPIPPHVQDKIRERDPDATFTEDGQINTRLDYDQLQEIMTWEPQPEPTPAS